MKKQNDREQTAYCGLWCGGCISGNHELFETARRLAALLEESGFENYAAYKATEGKNPVPTFLQYPAFREVLSELPGIECNPTCYHGPCSISVGCTPECPLRVCVKEKGLEGCWECSERSSCPDFAELDSRHPELQNNIECLQKHGAADWVRHRTPINIWEELKKQKG